jgi:hypothetical protein
MKATMMKISDPIIFGHCVKFYFKASSTFYLLLVTYAVSALHGPWPSIYRSKNIWYQFQQQDCLQLTAAKNGGMNLAAYACMVSPGLLSVYEKPY